MPTEPIAVPQGRPVKPIDDTLPLEYEADPQAPQTRIRWIVLALVFFAITINYVDRMVLGLVAPQILADLKISKTEYGNINSAFAWCYAFGQVISGRLLDKIGTRIGYAVALFNWSIASMCHGLARTASGFMVARGALGVTESPAFPAATKTLAEWFPKKERALAMGFVNAGSNLGAVVAPLAVPFITLRWGWQAAFYITGAAGLIWLAFWIPQYRRPHEHSRVSESELRHINSDAPEPTGRVRWVKLLTYRQTWAFVIGKFMTDPIWSFYLFWLPLFLKDRYNVSLAKVGLPMIAIYLMADIGSIGGGWLSSSLIKRGRTLNVARKSALLLCALCVVPSVATSSVGILWVSVFLAGMALAAHQGFSSNLYTLVSDTFPRRAVGSVAGLGGTFGYIGTALFMPLTGMILDKTGSYVPVFIMCGSAYIIAFAAIHLLAPRLDPAPIDEPSGFEVLPRGRA